MVEDLKRHGVFLNDPQRTLSKLFNAISNIIGRETAELMIQRILLKLYELNSNECFCMVQRDDNKMKYGLCFSAMTQANFPVPLHVSHSYISSLEEKSLAGMV